MEEYKFGKIYEDEIKPEDALYFAKIFGEGSLALTDLIAFCINNKIKTFASCKGHPEDKNFLDKLVENGYIAFRINDEMDLAYFLASLPSRIPGVKALVDYNCYNVKKTISIEVPATKPRMSEEYFKKILEELRRYVKSVKNGEKVSVDPEIKHVVDWIFYNPTTVRCYINNKDFNVVYTMDNNKVDKCPRGIYANAIHNILCSILDKPKKIEELLPERHHFI